jgi:hypothetical protein
MLFFALLQWRRRQTWETPASRFFPFLTTSLPHHSPSSSLPFFTTSLREFEDLKLVSSADPLSVFDAKQLGVFSHFGTFC